MRRTRVRDLLLWGQAAERAERREWERALAIVNTVSGIVGGEQVTIEDLYGAAPDRDDHAYEAFKGRTQDWAADLVTDFSPAEM